LADLLEFSKTVMPLSKIPDYVKEKTTEKRKLEEEIEMLKAQIETLQQQKEDAQSLRDIALQDEGMISSELRTYISLRKELRNYGIPVDDISKFAKLVNNIKEYGYDVGKVIQEFADLESLGSRRDTLQQIVQNIYSKISDLEQKHSALEVFVNAHNQLLNKYTYLEIMGFGLKQLQFLWNTVNEIARENNMPPKEAVTKFLSDVEHQYDNKLGFESKIEFTK
jgi:DNA repair exonuclease SbcCD ATPase subunit